MKINDHKYITTQEFNDLTAKNFTGRLKEADLVTKTDFDDKLKGFNQKINSNKTKHLLVENEIGRLKRISKDYMAVKYLFEEYGIQNYLVFQLMSEYVKVPDNKSYVLKWNLKEFLTEVLNLLQQLIICLILYWSMAIN